MLIDKFIQKIEECIPGYTPELVLDIGSRDLDQSFEFKKKYPKTKIIAFEPNPEQEEYIRSRKPSENDITFLPIGLGPERSTMTLHIPYGGNHGASSILEPMPSWAVNRGFYTKQVEVHRLDTILETRSIEKVDLVWMDVQGYELSVLDGFGKYLSTVDFMHLEAAEVPYYKGHPDKEAVLKYLDAFGFKMIHFEYAQGHPNREGDIIAINKRLIK